MNFWRLHLWTVAITYWFMQYVLGTFWQKYLPEIDGSY